jgi:hypothetical protein
MVRKIGGKVMIIQFRRGSGFVGRSLDAEFSTEKLSSKDSSEIEELVRQATFFELPDTIKAPVPMPDDIRYRLTIKSADKTHTVVVDESASPVELKLLLDLLEKKAMQE